MNKYVITWREYLPDSIEETFSQEDVEFNSEEELKLYIESNKGDHGRFYSCYQYNKEIFVH